jgi:hypothetical protein
VENEFGPTTMAHAMATIERFAVESGMTPRAVCDVFSAGMVATRVVAPHLLAKDRVQAAANDQSCQLPQSDAVAQ